MPNHPEHTWGHTIAFGEAYHRNAVKLISAIRDDMSIIAEVSAKAVEALRAGHDVYANVTTGHMPTYELVNEREGNPAPFIFNGNDSNTPEEYAAMGPGDVLLTNRVSHEVKAARDAGAYVVVFTTCYTNNQWTPPGEVHPNEDDLMPEDVASRVIESHIPWKQGLLEMPQVPEMPVFPGSANVTCTIHWMITAEVAQAMATGGMPDGTLGHAYADLLLGRLADMFAQAFDPMKAAAVPVAKRIIDGGHYFVQSGNEGVRSESWGVAAGLMMANAFEQRPATEGGDKDVTLIAAVNTYDAKELTLADEARANGHFIVGIGPMDHNDLKGRCDVYFSNQCDEPAGVLSIPGRDEKICPATGVMNNVMMQMFSAQFVDEMCRRGAVPYFYMGGYRTVGGPYNELSRKFFDERGY